MRRPPLRYGYTVSSEGSGSSSTAVKEVLVKVGICRDGRCLELNDNSGQKQGVVTEKTGLTLTTVEKCREGELEKNVEGKFESHWKMDKVGDFPNCVAWKEGLDSEVLTRKAVSVNVGPIIQQEAETIVRKQTLVPEKDQNEDIEVPTCALVDDHNQTQTRGKWKKLATENCSSSPPLNLLTKSPTLSSSPSSAKILFFWDWPNSK